MPNKVIYEFKKNATEKVNLEFFTYHDEGYLNLRLYYLAYVELDVWKPSRKGLALSCELLPDLKLAVDRAYEEWKNAVNQENER